ncbi:MAG: hypothetical protein KGJ59_14270 [Bacteroidota bacterium]|nr:hypothetical protein [Bacteroidota bacterium]
MRLPKKTTLFDTILYKDSLIEISADSILLKRYYFPFFTSKPIRFEQIQTITAEEPTLLNGKWRLQGTTDFRTWFPLDLARPKRDKIFFISLKGKTIRIGFTVEDSDTVLRILSLKGLVRR